MTVFQHKKLFKTKWFLPSLLIVLLTAGAFFLYRGHPPAYYLSIYEARTNNLIEQILVEPGDKMELSYVHSADGTPVDASFEIDEEGLRLIEEKYSWYGSGLESGSGYDFSFQGEEVTVSGYNRFFDQLSLRVARTVPQDIYVRDEVISINNLAPGGTLLVIRVEKK